MALLFPLRPGSETAQPESKIWPTRNRSAGRSHHEILGDRAERMEVMNFVALKMLIGDRAKYLGILMGLTFASLLITQQLSIFVGLMARTFGFLSDTAQADVWVMDPKVQFIDDIKPLQDTVLYRVRSVSGVEWAVPLYKGLIKARLADGNFQTCNVVGLDDATQLGGPPQMVQGKLADLRRSDGVIVDEVGAADKLAKVCSD